MSSPACRSVAGIQLVMVLLMAMAMSPINGSTSEKLDEGSVPGTPDSGTKCTGCSSCGNPCNLYPPPPPPKKSPKQKCPPPPPAPYFYITGPPGNLYPFDQYYSGSGRNSVVGLAVFVGCVLLGLLAF